MKFYIKNMHAMLYVYIKNAEQFLFWYFTPVRKRKDPKSRYFALISSTANFAFNCTLIDMYNMSCIQTLVFRKFVYLMDL